MKQAKKLSSHILSSLSSINHPTFDITCFQPIVFFFLLAQQPPVGQGFLIHEVSRSHTTTHHSGRTALEE